MFNLDIRTLFVVSTLISVFLSVASFVYRRTQTTYPGFGNWVIANVCVLFVYLLFALRGYIPDLLAIPLPLALSVFAAIYRWRGLQKFFDRPGSSAEVVLWTALTFVLLSVFTFQYDSPLIRNCIYSAILTYVVAGTIHTLYKIPDRRYRPLIRFFTTVYVFGGLALLVRAVLWLLYPVGKSLLDPNFMNILFFTAVPLMEISWAATFLMLNSRRLEWDMSEMHAQMEKLASTDSLTGVFNRRRFFEIGEKEVDRARRYNRPLSVLMMDLNEFKLLNDDMGHCAGDHALCELTRICQENLRKPETIARLGGDEFAVILPETDLTGAREVAKRLHKTILSSPARICDQEVFLSLSIGAAALESSDRSLEQILQRADVSMFQMKKKIRTLKNPAYEPAQPVVEQIPEPF
ncbi:MAG: GGDEF domain-containing protein [Anaerolineaceae bacterium]|nr:GGDEF domain-containing protein [Anaerolineaceae bacterium]